MQAALKPRPLLQLLLGPQIIGMSTLLLPTICRTWMQPGVALAANHLVTIILLGQDPERGLDDAASQSQNEMERRFLLDVVVRQSAAILQLLTSEDQPLLVGRYALLVLDLSFHILDCVRRLYLESDSFACESFHENLHCGVPINKNQIQLSALTTNLIFTKVLNNLSSHYLNVRHTSK